MDEVQMRKLQLKQQGETVTDINGDLMATVKPKDETFIADFRKSSDATEEYLEQEAIRAAGGR